MATFLDVEMEHHYAPQNWLMFVMFWNGLVTGEDLHIFFYEKE